MTDTVPHTIEDGRSQIKPRGKEQTVWLSHREISELFDVSTDNIGLPLRGFFEDGELICKATTEDFSVARFEGAR